MSVGWKYYIIVYSCTSLPDSTFSDTTLIARNWRRWDCLHHGNGQTLQISAWFIVFCWLCGERGATQRPPCASCSVPPLPLPINFNIVLILKAKYLKEFLCFITAHIERYIRSWSNKLIMETNDVPRFPFSNFKSVDSIQCWECGEMRILWEAVANDYSLFTI